MSKTIRRYSVLTLFSICLVLLLSLLIFHATDFAFAQTYRTFTVTTVSGSGTNPHAATDDNGYIYVTYEGSVYFKKSTDNGATFPSTFTVGTGNGYFPRLAINNLQQAYVIYTYPLSSACYFPWALKSDTSYNFSKILDDDVAAQAAMSLSRCDIAVENVGGTDNVYAVWEDDDTLSGPWHIHFAGEIGNDGDTTFTEPAAAAISTSADARYPVIAVKKSEEAHVYVAWVHLGNHIMFDYSTNGGTGWQAADIQISHDNPGTAVVENQRPGLAASSSTDAQVFAVWTDSRNSNRDIYFNYSSDGGTTWQPADVKLGNNSYAAYGQDQPSIAVKPGSTNLYAAWRDTRDGTNHIYFQEGKWTGSAFKWGIDRNSDGDLDDTGEEGDDVRVSTTASGNEETPTVLANGSDEVYVIWRDTGAGIKCARYGPGPGVDAPSAPTNLTAAAGNGKVDLDWDDNTETDFSSYKVYRSTTRGQWDSFLVEGLATSSYTDSSAANGTCYWYVVTAVDTEGYESNYSNDAHATPNADDTTKPLAPTVLTATAGNLEVSLSWTASTSTDVSGYQIYRSTVSGSGYSYVAAVIPVYVDDPTTSYTDTGLVAGVVYYYVVAAVDTSNNESSDSNEANAAPLDESGQVVSPPAEFPAGPGLLRTADGDCFIATAAYGTPLAIEVRILSRLRDNVLLSSGMGRQFVKTYYKLSPPLAGFIARRPWLKMIVRAWLKPIVKVSRILAEE